MAELILERPLGDSAIEAFLSEVKGGGSDKAMERTAFPALKSRPACEYHNYKGLGVSLCFENFLLQGVHVYNGTHGYSRYKGELPHGLRLNMKGREIVELLGEPDGKMGGGRGGAVCIAYKDKGLQINFVGSNWEDKDNLVDSVTIHKPALALV